MAKTDLREQLLNVRKAHRLLKEYQQAMLEIVFKISDDLNLPIIGGNAPFSWHLRSTRKDEYVDFSIRREMWAWDYLPSYLFEYYFGEHEIEGNKRFSLSVFQVSDTGFKNTENRLELNDFQGVEAASSCLVFLLELKYKENGGWLWNRDNHLDLLTEAIKEGEFGGELEKGRLLYMRVPLEHFSSAEAFKITMDKFRTLVKEKFDFELPKGQAE